MKELIKDKTVVTNMVGINPGEHITITDAGYSKPDNHIPYVFDHFYKADSSRGDKNHFGLGLPIAKELIELHNGKITLKNTNGGGTTFVISINIK